MSGIYPVDPNRISWPDEPTVMEPPTSTRDWVARVVVVLMLASISLWFLAASVGSVYFIGWILGAW